MNKIKAWVMPVMVYLVPFLWGVITSLVFKNWHWTAKWLPILIVVGSLILFTIYVMISNYIRLRKKLVNYESDEETDEEEVEDTEEIEEENQNA